MSSLATKRIAYAWGLAFAPHVLKLVILGTSGYKWDNAIGRHNMQKDKKDMHVSETALGLARRADAAHQNGNESFPLFAAAVIAAMTAGLDSATIDSLTSRYLILRYVCCEIMLRISEESDLLQSRIHLDLCFGQRSRNCGYQDFGLVW
jgi:uncharacterized MAPEG superfamily protein